MRLLSRADWAFRVYFLIKIKSIEGTEVFMSRFLERFAEFINENGYNTFRIAEIYNGGEPESMTLRPSSSCLNTYSISKAFSVTAIGILYDRGLYFS